MDKLIEWLPQNIPDNDESSIVHGHVRLMIHHYLGCFGVTILSIYPSLLFFSFLNIDIVLTTLIFDAQNNYQALQNHIIQDFHSQDYAKLPDFCSNHHISQNAF